MNAIGMLFQHMPQPRPAIGSTGPANKEGAIAVFQAVLSKQLPEKQGLMKQLFPGSLPLEGAKPMPEKADSEESESLPMELETVLLQWMRQPVSSQDPQAQLIMESAAEAPHAGQVIHQLSAAANQPIPGSANTEGGTSNPFAEIAGKLKALLVSLNGQGDVQRASPKILELLEQWTALEKKGGLMQGNPEAILKSEKPHFLQELLLAYQKREQLAGKLQYNQEAKVTSNDVAKWVAKAFDKYQVIDKSFSPHPTVISTNTPIGKLEQYVIHLQQTQNAPAPDKQLIEQFQNAVKSSRFLAGQNGMNQLQVAFRPENLGEMMVRLTQINGEMTVKIIVSSQAAKEMLEGNLHQLRNMFSPQQVVIEKEDVQFQQGNSLSKEEEAEQMNDRDQEQPQQSESGEDEQNHSESDFQAQFQELLMNEKV
ncbi:flagellar hook-length control protein FliK [Lentibacillus sediminis]|uniref:flagellar hook-length control protein FliK n=1 Tax=Lentibacillus sediminis TaxID=1940529 RepID=UPI000C1C5AFB|nr:flagellar hook-length control protein FliK [Lentibacillus sediminis]